MCLVGSHPLTDGLSRFLDKNWQISMWTCDISEGSRLIILDLLLTCKQTAYNWILKLKSQRTQERTAYVQKQICIRMVFFQVSSHKHRHNNSNNNNNNNHNHNHNNNNNNSTIPQPQTSSCESWSPEGRKSRIGFAPSATTNTEWRRWW